MPPTFATRRGAQAEVEQLRQEVARMGRELKEGH